MSREEVERLMSRRRLRGLLQGGRGDLLAGAAALSVLALAALRTPAANTPERRILVRPAAAELGSLRGGETRTISVELRNPLAHPRVVQVISSCDCAVPSRSEIRIGPDEAYRLEVGVRAKSQPGHHQAFVQLIEKHGPGFGQCRITYRTVAGLGTPPASPRARGP